MMQPAFLAVIVDRGTLAHARYDGVLVIPATTLTAQDGRVTPPLPKLKLYLSFGSAS